MLRPLMEKVVMHRFGLRGLDGGALHRARQSVAARAHGQQPGGLLTTTSIVENFPGFPEGVDGYEFMTRMQKEADVSARARALGWWKKLISRNARWS